MCDKYIVIGVPTCISIPCVLITVTVAQPVVCQSEAMLLLKSDYSLITLEPGENTAMPSTAKRDGLRIQSRLSNGCHGQAYVQTNISAFLSRVIYVSVYLSTYLLNHLCMWVSICA